MAVLKKDEKALRLVSGRRYGNQGNVANPNNVTPANDSVEPFTSVLDINASEIYTQQNYIPTGSLPFSGSSQHGHILKTDGTIVTTLSVNDPLPEGALLRYWYRHRLTETNKNDQSVYFFLNPGGASENASQ